MTLKVLVGNRSSETFTPPGGSPESTTYTYSSTSNRIATVTDTAGTVIYGYDANGNTLDDGDNTFVYDDRNRFVTAIDPSTQQAVGSYGYNALGQRAFKTTAGGSVLFVYDEAGHLLGEYDATGNAIRQYVWLHDRPVAMLTPNGSGTDVYFIHSDHLNTPKVVTDGSQQVVWKGDYEPFGKVAETVSNVEMNLRFPGQYEDGETGLNYNYFRSYDSSLGRYTQVDPLGLAAGNNLYHYTWSNPLRYSDFYGLDTLPGSPNPRAPQKPSPPWKEFVCTLVNMYDNKFHEEYIRDANEQHEENRCQIDEACKQSQSNCTRIADPLQFAECVRAVSGECRKTQEREHDRYREVLGAIEESRQSTGWLKEICETF